MTLDHKLPPTRFVKCDVIGSRPRFVQGFIPCFVNLLKNSQLHLQNMLKNNTCRANFCYLDYKRGNAEKHVQKSRTRFSWRPAADWRRTFITIHRLGTSNSPFCQLEGHIYSAIPTPVLGSAPTILSVRPAL